MQQDYPAPSAEPVCSRPVDAMTNLSPAAQAVLDAFLYDWPDNPLNSDRHCLAVALCAVADQFFTDWDGMCCAEHLKSIAAELEGAQ